MKNRLIELAVTICIIMGLGSVAVAQSLPVPSAKVTLPAGRSSQAGLSQDQMKGSFCNDPDMKYDQSLQYHPEDRLEKATTSWSEKKVDGTVVVKTMTDECKGDFLKEYHCMEYNFDNPDQTRFTTLKCSDYGQEKCINGACVPVDKDGNPISGPGGNGGSTTPCGGQCKANEECVDGTCQKGGSWCDGQCGTPGCPLCDVQSSDCVFVDSQDTANSYFVGGSVKFKQDGLAITKADACLDESYVMEYGCIGDKKLQEQYKCEQGCDAATGSCMKGGCIDADANAGTTTVEILWEEFSFDHKYATPSSAYVQDGSVKKGEKNDYCIDGSGNKVEKGVAVAEAYCKANVPAYEGFTCPQEVTMFGYTQHLFDGCCGGACYKEKGSCVDADDGLIFDKAASAIKGNGCGNPPDVKVDACGIAKYGQKGEIVFSKSGEYGDSVLEYTCDGNGEIQEQWHLCDEGENWGCYRGACVDFESGKDAKGGNLSEAICHSKSVGLANAAGGPFGSGVFTSGLKIKSTGAVPMNASQFCSHNQVKWYACANVAQSGKSAGDFVKPQFYMIEDKKKCKEGCAAAVNDCPYCVEDLKQFPSGVVRSFCGD